MSRRTFLLLFLSCLSVFMLPVSTPAGTSGRDEIIGCRHIDYYDGTSDTIFLLREADTGRIQECTAYDLRKRLSPAAWQSLIVHYTGRWPDGKKSIRFQLTPLSSNHKKRFSKTLRKLKNARRGTTKVPKIKVTKTVAKMQKGTNQFNQADGVNTIVMSSDDRYFGAKSGVAAFCILRWNTTYAGDGVTIERMLLTETDAFYPSNFFWQSELQWQTILIHEFGHVLGYQHSAWTNDYMSYRRQLITQNKLNDKNSDIWDVSRERDRLYYPGDKEEQDTPRLLPFDGTVIDIGYMDDGSTKAQIENKIEELLNE